MDPVRPEFLPDPGLSRDGMETLQHEIADTARFEDDPDPSWGTASDSRPLVAGIDQAFFEDRAVSAIVVLQGERVVERTHAISPLSIPYIPGLLAFREGAPIVDALSRLSCDPDVLLFDGSGRIHFREAGLATHIGVLFDRPAVGVTKSLLCGHPKASPERRPAGWRTPIVADESVSAPAGTTIGYAYQSKQYAPSASTSINPLYVSPGHRTSAERAVDLVAECCTEYKLPEPIRLADRYANQVKL